MHSTPGCLLLLEPVSRLLCLATTNFIETAAWNKASHLLGSLSFLIPALVPIFGQSTPVFRTVFKTMRGDQELPHCKESQVTEKTDGWSIHSGLENMMHLFTLARMPQYPPLKVNLLLWFHDGTCVALLYFGRLAANKNFRFHFKNFLGLVSAQL